LSFFFASRPISDPDLWCHLNSGKYIAQNGAVPRVDAASCTNFGQPYVAHGWLSDIFFYVIYSRFGANPLVFLFAVFTTLAFWIIFRRSDEYIFVRGFAMLLGVWTVLPNIGVRPRVFTLLIFAAYFIILDRYLVKPGKRYLWLLVPLMVLWVNLHGGFMLGLTLIGLAIVGQFIDTQWAEQNLKLAFSRSKPLVLVFIACAIAALLNPYGPQIYSHVIRVLMSPVYQYVIVDWLPPDFHQSEQLPLIILILLNVVVLALSSKRPRPSEVLFFIATLYMTLKMQRNAMIFAVVASSLLADYGGGLWESLFPKTNKSPALSNPNRRLAALSFLLLLPLVFFVIKLKKSVYRPPAQRMAAVPLAAVQFLNDNGLSGCTFTDPNVWGAYVMWAAPNNPVYIDGRDMYPTQFVREYVQIIQGQKDWRGPFEQYHVTNAIMMPSSLLTKELEQASEWKEVYRDDYSVAFRRR